MPRLLAPSPRHPRRGTLRPYCALLIAVFILFAEGCASTATTAQPTPVAKKDLLSFLHAGQTSREEVLVALGAPSWAFEHERILTYRLGYDDKQGYSIVSPRRLEPWANVRYSLVLVFDSNGVLKKQSMVDVK